MNTWLNPPAGINLMDNTTMPLLGLVGTGLVAEYKLPGGALAAYLERRYAVPR